MNSKSQHPLEISFYRQIETDASSKAEKQVCGRRETGAKGVILVKQIVLLSLREGAAAGAGPLLPTASGIAR